MMVFIISKHSPFALKLYEQPTVRSDSDNLAVFDHPQLKIIHWGILRQKNRCHIVMKYEQLFLHTLGEIFAIIHSHKGVYSKALSAKKLCVNACSWFCQVVKGIFL